MNYIIGDIHGEIKKLINLIETIEKSDQNPTYVFLGDYLDKGEDVLETLKFLTDLNKNKDCTFLIGNHEYIWLNFDENDENSRKYILNYGGKATMRSLKTNSLQEAKNILLDKFSFFLLS